MTVANLIRLTGAKSWHPLVSDDRGMATFPSSCQFIMTTYNTHCNLNRSLGLINRLSYAVMVKVHLQQATKGKEQT